MIKVYCKPINTGVEDYQKPFKLNDQAPLTIETYRPEMRIGAFEVQLCKKKDGKTKIEQLHSKLNTRMWPNINVVLSKICIFACLTISQICTPYNY